MTICRCRGGITVAWSGTLKNMGEPTEELPSTLRHQMDDWDDKVRVQQLGFREAAEELEEQVERLRLDLAATRDEGTRHGIQYRLTAFTEMARTARIAARIQIPIPEDGISVREDPDGPGGLAYTDVVDVDPKLAESLRRASERRHRPEAPWPEDDIPADDRYESYRCDSMDDEFRNEYSDRLWLSDWEDPERE